MTRGTIFLITKGKLYYTREFNGAMYIHGFGGDMVNKLENTNSSGEFKAQMIVFNELNFGYPEKVVYSKKLKVASSIHDIVFNKETYFKDYFSDYTYWKNISGREIRFKDINEKEVIVKNDNIAIFNFGKLYIQVYKNLTK
jgi:hypothetical protein